MIVYIQRVFADYRLACYNRISKKFDFQLWHTNNVNGISQVKTDYSRNIKSWKFGKTETSVYFFVLWKLLKQKPQIIIHEFAIGIISLPLTFLYCKIFSKKLILYSHGYDRKKGFQPHQSLADKYRLWFMRKADALIVYSIGDKDLLSAYVTKEKIFVAQNTLDTSNLLDVRNALRLKGRERVREELGWNNNIHHLIYVGRLYKAKLIDWLLKSVLLIKERGIAIQLHIVGDGEELANLKVITEELKLGSQIKFYGTITNQQQLGNLLYASDLMVMPGAVGLSVNQAFCFDLPVLTIASKNYFPAHGPEIEYIEHLNTGIIVKEHTTDGIASGISNYLSNMELQNAMREAVAKKIEKDLTINKMVDGITSSIHYVLRKK